MRHKTTRNRTQDNREELSRPVGICRHSLFLSSMSNQSSLSTLPPATLRAALKASEERVKREKEKLQREMRNIQKRLDQLKDEEDVPASEKEPERVIAGSSRRQKNQLLVIDTSSEDEPDVRPPVRDDRQLTIAKIRSRSRPASSKRYVSSAGQINLMTQNAVYPVHGVRRGEYIVSGRRASVGSQVACLAAVTKKHVI